MVSKADEKHIEQGTIEWVMSDPVVAFMWMDKRPVYVMSTIHNVHTDADGTFGSVERKAGDGTKVVLSCPQAVVDYIQFMRCRQGDQMITLYKLAGARKSGGKESFATHLSAQSSMPMQISYNHFVGHTPLLKFKMELAEQLIGNKRFRKLMGSPRSHPKEDRLIGAGAHIAKAYTDGRRRDCVVCREKDLNANRDPRANRSRIRTYCTRCDVALCIYSW